VAGQYAPIKAILLPLALPCSMIPTARILTLRKRRIAVFPQTCRYRLALAYWTAMANSKPIAARNEWSCALACISWSLTRSGTPISQDDLIYRFGVYYPEWTHRPGLLSRGDVLSLLSRSGCPYRRFVHLHAKDEVLKAVTDYYADYLLGFVFTRKPTNHCMAIVNWNADSVNLMNPDPNNPTVLSMNWDNLFTCHDADVLWVFK